MEIPTGKTVQATLPLCIGLWVFAVTSIGHFANAQLVDSLDAYPPRWSLHRSDCDARVVSHQHERDASAEGGMCEVITLQCTHGSEAVLVYPIEPLRVINDLNATLSVKGVREGIRVGLRIRYPYLLDPVTRRPAEVMVYGAEYRRAGQFQKLGVGLIESAVQLKTVSLRQQYGSSADVTSPYVDAIVINAYGGAGTASLRIDDIRMEAMVPIGDEGWPARPVPAEGISVLEPSSTDPVVSSKAVTGLNEPSRDPFPIGRLTRILQYNGEPLAWVRSLGFDAVWLSRPPDAALLNEAIVARMQVYSPPPSSPNPRLEPILEPVTAWIVGAGVPMDSSHRDEIEIEIERLRAFPSRWQRPLVGCPAEDFRLYGGLLDGAVTDAPPRSREVSSVESRAIRRDQQMRLGACPMAVAVVGGPPSVSVLQSDAISGRIGSSMNETFTWQSLWNETATIVADAPPAILVRSGRSLVSGLSLDQNRSLALSYINRQIAALVPWVAGSSVDPQSISLDNYDVHSLTNGPTTLMFLTSAMVRDEHVLAGDGKTIRLKLPPGAVGKLIWRLTDFSAERLDVQTDSTGTYIEIVSPDVVEVLAISDQIAQGGKLAASAGRFAQQASQDRWQLAATSLRQCQQDWQHATATGIIKQSPPTDLLSVATSTLSQTETLVRTGDFPASLHLARRADAWILKSQWMLFDALRESTDQGSDALVSSPPLLAGNVETHMAWWPLLDFTPATTTELTLRKESTQDSQQRPLANRSMWGRNLLSGGDLDRPDSLSREGWVFGKRHPAWADTEVIWVDRGARAGRGAISARVIPKGDSPLPGGYEGTLLLIRSGPVRIPPGSAVRIDAYIKTIGFGGPHQGCLVYDSIGTQELGVLVRGRPNWTPVTLIRQTVDDSPLHVMFELIGGGEAMIDEVQIRIWDNEPAPTFTAQ